MTSRELAFVTCVLLIFKGKANGQAAEVSSTSFSSSTAAASAGGLSGGQFVIPAVIRPMFGGEYGLSTPAVPSFNNFPYPTAPYPMIIGQDDDNDRFRNIMYFLIFALSRRGGFGGNCGYGYGGGCNGGCGGGYNCGCGGGCNGGCGGGYNGGCGGGCNGGCGGGCNNGCGGGCNGGCGGGYSGGYGCNGGYGSCGGSYDCGCGCTGYNNYYNTCPIPTVSFPTSTTTTTDSGYEEYTVFPSSCGCGPYGREVRVVIENASPSAGGTK